MAAANSGLQGRDPRILYKVIFVPLVTDAAVAWRKYATKANKRKLKWSRGRLCW